MIIDLDGEWKLSYLPAIRGEVESPIDGSAEGVSTIAAAVPGNVELDLVRAGVLSDPFQGSNIDALRQYETYEWWYEREFDTPAGCEGKRSELVFHGADCYATYWLNGVLVGRSENALVEHAFDVTQLLAKSGGNRLVVRLQSPIVKAAEVEYEPLMEAAPNNWPSLWARKPPHCYGWDIMPRAVSAGLWRSVVLVVHDEVEITDLYLYTVHAGTRAADGSQSPARLTLFYRLAIDPSLLSGCVLRVVGTCGSSRFELTDRVHFAAGKLDVRVPDPRLWWPAGYGEANLYQVVVEVIRGGQVVASRPLSLGIRTAELVRSEITSPDRPGQFLFRVNGTPIMCKGTNWVPADAFHSRDAGRYREMLDLAIDLGCNMIRCWGGNVYEDHAFFDICDRAGIMVWQDFAMACAMYPQAEAFLAAVEREAIAVVRKLRQHPSLVLWCGDNECDNQWPVPSENRLTREVLPRVVSRLDSARPFVPSSPYWSPEAARSRNTDLLPERHLWRPRDYFKSRRYTEHAAHFVGEIGYHGCPNVSSIERFVDAKFLWPWHDNPQWVLHGSESLGSSGPWAYRSQLMADQVREMFGMVPDNLPEFAFCSQVAQAEAKKFFIEMTRLAKWRRTGVLWWNLIDGWPQFSDAVVDYYFVKKLAYYYIRRVQRPICIMVDELSDWKARVVAGNDSLRDVSGSFRVKDADSGEVLLEGPFHVAANENVELGSCKLYHSDQRLLLIEWDVAGERRGNHRLMGSPPFSASRYRAWLARIAALPEGFVAQDVAR